MVAKGQGSTRGRPTMLTAARHKKIVELILQGNWPATAAACAGVSAETLRIWLRKGANTDEDNIYSEFYYDFTVAMGEGEAMRVGRINEAGQRGEWKADAWALERLHKDRWGKTQTVENVHSVKVDRFAERAEEDLMFFSQYGYFPEEAPKVTSG